MLESKHKNLWTSSLQQSLLVLNVLLFVLLYFDDRPLICIPQKIVDLQDYKLQGMAE